MKEYFEDDRYIVPDDIKRMTPEEIKQEIERLEDELLKSEFTHNRPVQKKD